MWMYSTADSFRSPQEYESNPRDDSVLRPLAGLDQRRGHGLTSNGRLTNTSATKMLELERSISRLGTTDALAMSHLERWRNLVKATATESLSLVRRGVVPPNDSICTQRHTKRPPALTHLTASGGPTPLSTFDMSQGRLQGAKGRDRSMSSQMSPSGIRGVERDLACQGGFEYVVIDRGIRNTPTLL